MEAKLRDDGGWRLINGSELYNVYEDRGQLKDIAADHPELVEKLREGYEEWWNLVKPDFDNEIPIEIGSDENEVRLCSHDWRNDDGEVVWNQQQVREGLPLNGYWEIDVLRKAVYEIELCRWPREGCGKALTEGMESGDIMWNHEGVAPDSTGLYSGGRRINITSAVISIGDIIRKQALNENRALFKTEIPAGPNHLSAAFTTEDGTELGAYYCYVRLSD